MWKELLVKSHTVDKDDPDGAITERLVIKNHGATQEAGAVIPQKRTWDKALLEDLC